MKFLPVVERELRVHSRRRSTYYSRISTVTLAVFFVLQVAWASPNMDPPHLSGMLFKTLSWVGFWICLVAGIIFTSDCLSEEKRDGTLGFLFLTDLNAWDIILGKLVSRSIGAFYGLLAVTPVLSIPLLLGGVAGSEVLRLVIVLLSVLIFSLCAGVMASAFSTSSRGAGGMTLLCVGLLTLGPQILISAYGTGGSMGQFSVVSSMHGIGLIPEMLYKAAPAGFWVSCGLQLSYAVICLAVASWVLPHAWREKASKIGPTNESLSTRIQKRWRRFITANPAVRSRRLDVNPIYWLSSRDNLKLWLPWVFLISMGVIWAWIGLKVGDDWLNEATYFLTTFGLFLVFKIWTASEASARFWEDRKTGALDLLMATPLSVGEIMRGHQLSYHRYFLWPLFFVCCVAQVFMVAPYWSKLFANPGDEGWTLLFLSGLIVFVSDVVACFWMGLWFGLITPRANRASAMVLTRILILPWILFTAYLFFLGVLQSMNIDVRDKLTSGHWTLGAWVIISISNSLYWTLTSRTKLYVGFREIIASQRGEEETKSGWRTRFGI